MPTTKAPLIEFSHAAGCEFHTPFAASRVDRANGIIREVGLITSGVKARGHELHVDDTTLAQMLACGAGKATVGFGGPGRSRPNAMKDDLFHTKGELRSSPNPFHAIYMQRTALASTPSKSS